MTKRSNLAAAALALGCAFLFAAGPASALGLKDCSDKYSASKSKKSFAEFQKTECGADAKPAAAAPTAAKPADVKAATPAAGADAAKAKADAKTAAKTARAEKRKADKAAKDAAAKATVAVPVKDAVYPAKIADEFKTKKPSKARFSTCLAQYKANKATNANGGMKWIQKNGGYFSACNKKLKG